MKPAVITDLRAVSHQPAIRNHAAAVSNILLANLSQREIPSLYGLRGIAALTVVLYHYLLPTKLSGIVPGPHAVTLFFELSGLLITWLLLNEIEITGRVDWKLFYCRRALRLFPLFYVVWGLCRLKGPFSGSVATFFYLGDYYTALTGNYSLLTSAWSLGVEEKFYLLWPLLLMMLKGPNRIKVLVGILLLEPVYRSILVLAGFRTYTWFAFDTHLDGIVLGCLLAFLVKDGWHAPQWLLHPATPCIALVLFFALQSQGEVVTCLLAVILLSVICRPPRFLNSAAAKYFGRISYALYLCHEYTSVVLRPRLFPHGNALSLPSSLAVDLGLAIAFASVLHFAVERPFLRIRYSFRPFARAMTPQM
jgi:peptidoglycan/LPS O-acetylase OafA/YrhL